MVKTGAEGEGRCADGMEIIRPNSLVDIADLGLTLAEAKRLLASVQQEIVTAQATDPTPPGSLIAHAAATFAV